MTGAECSRGVAYARSEISDPRRIFTSTVRLDGSDIKMVPVRTDRPIKKQRWKQAVELVKGLKAIAPVAFGQVIEKDFTEKDINLVSSREIKKA